jgi:hypothetical protein
MLLCNFIDLNPNKVKKDLRIFDILRDFEKTATNMLQASYERNPDDAELLLLREVPEFGNTTPLQIAAMSDHKNFLSNQSCQQLLAKIWFGQIFVDAPLFNVT